MNWKPERIGSAWQIFVNTGDPWPLTVGPTLYRIRHADGLTDPTPAYGAVSEARTLWLRPIRYAPELGRSVSGPLEAQLIALAAPFLLHVTAFHPPMTVSKRTRGRL